MAEPKQCFEDRRIGQVIISGLIIAFFCVGVVQNLPPSAIRNTLAPATKNLAKATFLSQKWSMYTGFEGDVKSNNIKFKLTMADGQIKSGHVVPQGPQWDLGIATTYPWKAVQTNLKRNKKARAEYSNWLVREFTRPGQNPVRVELIVTETVIPTPDPWKQKSAKTKTWTLWDTGPSGAKA